MPDYSDFFKVRRELIRRSKVNKEQIMKIEKGMKFHKQLSKGKYCICEVVAFVDRIDRDSKQVLSTEIWAKSDNYNSGKAFEVSKTTVTLGLIKE